MLKIWEEWDQYNHARSCELGDVRYYHLKWNGICFVWKSGQETTIHLDMDCRGLKLNNCYVVKSKRRFINGRLCFEVIYCTTTKEIIGKF